MGTPSNLCQCLICALDTLGKEEEGASRWSGPAAHPPQPPDPPRPRDALRDAAEGGLFEQVWCLSPDRLASGPAVGERPGVLAAERGGAGLRTGPAGIGAAGQAISPARPLRAKAGRGGQHQMEPAPGRTRTLAAQGPASATPGRSRGTPQS